MGSAFLLCFALSLSCFRETTYVCLCLVLTPTSLPRTDSFNLKFCNGLVVLAELNLALYVSQCMKDTMSSDTSKVSCYILLTSFQDSLGNTARHYYYTEKHHYIDNMNILKMSSNQSPDAMVCASLVK